MKVLLEQLQQVRNEIQVKKEGLDEAKERKSNLEVQILEAMKGQELRSARYENLTATIAERSTLKVVNEKEIVKYLKDKNLTDYISERPNDLFEVFRRQAEKERLDVPGTEMQTTEYLSIRAKKEEVK